MTAKKEMFDLSTLRVNPRNPYPERESDFGLLKDKINEHPKFLALRPIVYDDQNIEDGKFLILGGNKRFKALLALDHKDVPHEWVKAASDLTEEEKHEFVLADNVGFGSWDVDIVLEDWGQEIVDEWGIDLPDFEEEEIKPEEDDFNQPLPTHAKTVLGDLYELHSLDKGLVHRVQCGDSNSIDSIYLLMDGNLADLVMTDPPYNIASESKNFAADVSKAMNDLKESKWDQDFEIEPSVLNAISVSKESSVYYIWTSHFLFARILDVLNEFCDFTSYVVWSKPNPMPSLSKRHPTWNTELCVYGTRGSNRIVNFPKEGHFLSCREVIKKSDGTHPTQKPIDLICPLMSFSSASKSLVLDPFLGSGTTLIASEQLERNCYGQELDEKYMDIIVKRWAKYMADNDLEFKILRNGEEVTEEEWILEIKEA